MKTHPRDFVPAVLAFAALALNLTAFQPASAAAFTTTSPMSGAHEYHTATLLPNGKVLVAGGFGSSITNRAQLHDPATGTWTLTGALGTGRQWHTATLLANGKVLVAGGVGSSGATNSTELFDPATGTWTATGAMTTSRYDHTATLLPNGTVLVAGGNNGLTSSELYDPVTETWTATISAMSFGRFSHTATLLPNGKVLVAGGNSTLSELYDPATGTWTTTGTMGTLRRNHTATLLSNGQVLAAGGYGFVNPSFRVLGSVEMYNPTNGTWATLANSLNSPRRYHTASLLPNGTVLVAGGEGTNSPPAYLASAEVFNLGTLSWAPTNGLATAREFHTATLLSNGKVLVAGGDRFGALSSVEQYEPAVGTWAATGALPATRNLHSATLLPNGKVLVAGNNGAGLNSAALYNPATGTWTNTGSMNNGRYAQSAILLPNGKVLVAGGNTLSTATELYDPAAGTWANAGSLAALHYHQTGTLLPNGKVLIAGGEGVGGGASVTNSAELYDPLTLTWTNTGPLNTAREYHTATLLPNGQVLVTGGHNNNFAFPNDTLASVELYDPATGAWTTNTPLAQKREKHTATLLPNGKVLVVGGDGGSSGYLTSAVLYDAATATWTATGPLTQQRADHAATLLPNGKVLVVGGQGGSGSLASVELYDPATGTWTTTGALTTGRIWHTLTLLPNGKVLVAGGYNAGALSTAQLYDTGLGFSSAWQPQISALTSPLSLGSSLVITGSLFRGISGASGGNTQDSPGDNPVVQLRSLEGERTIFLSSTNWSTNSFTSAPVWGFPPGYALATIFVNGIPSTGSVFNISVPIPTVTTLGSGVTLSNGAFQFTFANTPGAVLGVLALADLGQPLSSATALGGITEVAPGQFQCTDPGATNNQQRFYLLRAP